MNPTTENTASELLSLDDPFFSPSPDSSGSEAPSESPLEDEDNKVETHAVGELIKSESADFTVKKIEDLKTIQSTFGPALKAKPGKKLWLLKVRWKNNTKEAALGACFGPSNVQLRVYDIDGVEMLGDDESVHIKGNDCDTGLMKGETGTWLKAFHGTKADFGWAVFEDYKGENSYVTLDPDLQLERVTE